MARLANIPKTLLFTQHLQPDARLLTIEDAIENTNNIRHTPRILKEGAFSWTLPEPRQQYRFLTANPQALNDLGIDPSQVNDPDFRDIVSGNAYSKIGWQQHLPFPYAQAYAGWQFGLFAGQLGDGRALSLFEIPRAAFGSTNNYDRPLYEVQLKGLGLTPYSRFADGKAVLRLSIREYIISEHLNAIGIPLTRALAITFLPQTYARRHRAEKCAVIARFAPLWVRLGTFDLYRSRNDREGLLQLSKYVIDELLGDFHHLSEAVAANPLILTTANEQEFSKYDKMYFEIVTRNARSTALWQAYGFLNGVLNTDNCSVLGLALDFGPFSIMDRFDPHYTPNSEDHSRRYSHENTPTAMWWNLTRLGEDLAELLGVGPTSLANLGDHDFMTTHEDAIIDRATRIIVTAGELFQYQYTKTYVETMLRRLGLSPKLMNPLDPGVAYADIVAPLLSMLRLTGCDYNKFFVMLENLQGDLVSQAKLFVPEHDETTDADRQQSLSNIEDWLKKYSELVVRSHQLDPEHTRPAHPQYNPLFLPRNWILDEVIAFTEESDGTDVSQLNKLQKMATYPFDKSKWGDDLKDLEARWMLQGDKGDDFTMLQCSCSS